MATDKKPKITCSLNINKKIYCKPLSHLIYLFFNRSFPEVIVFEDGNPVNTKIDNIKNVSNSVAKQNNPGKGYRIIKGKNNKIYFKACHCRLGKNYSLGWYGEKSQAELITQYSKKLIIEGLKDIEEIKEKKKEFYPWATFRIKKNRLCPPGVYRRGDKFRSAVKLGNKKINLGTFSSAAEAHQAYLKAKKELTNE